MRTSKGAKTEIILPSAVIKQVSKLKNSDVHLETMKFLINSPDIKLMAMENNLEVGLGVNRAPMSLRLYKMGNTYDFISHYTSSEGDAVEFANELFN